MVINRVDLSDRAEKQLRKVPQHVAVKVMSWVDEVEEAGLEEVRRIPGYKDHPLKGKLKGKRAIYLTRKWRAVYEIKEDRATEPVVEFVELQEVHSHEYR